MKATVTMTKKAICTRSSLELWIGYITKQTPAFVIILEEKSGCIFTELARNLNLVGIDLQRLISILFRLLLIKKFDNIFHYLEMYHQQFQGVPKNKKSTGGSSRNKSLQSSGKPASGKEQSHNQSSNVNKETTPKKEKKSTTQTTPVITRFIISYFRIKLESKENSSLSLN